MSKEESITIIQLEEEQVESIKEETAKEEPIVQSKEPKQEEQSEEPKEEVKDNTLRIECGIDYDKLAEAIVRAQIKYDQIKEENGTETQEEKTEEDTKIKEGETTDKKQNKHWKIKAIINLFRGIPDDNLRVDEIVPFTATKSLDLMSIIIRWIGTVGVVVLAVARFVNFKWSGWSNWLLGITMIYVAFAIILVLNLYAGLLKLMSIKLSKEKDKNYIIAVFSAFSGFFALIVAIVALAIAIIGRFVSC